MRRLESHVKDQNHPPNMDNPALMANQHAREGDEEVLLHEVVCRNVAHWHALTMRLSDAG